METKQEKIKQMKNNNFLVYAILGLLVALVVVIGSLYLNSKKETPVIGNLRSEGKDLVKISRIELQKHNTNTNCYIGMEKRVFDITNFLKIHPGGIPKITKACGQVIDNLSSSHPGGEFTSPKIQGMLETYYIGDLEG